MPFKTCSQCDETKPLSEFRRNNQSADGRRPECKQCSREYDRRYRNRPGKREKMRAYSRKHGKKYRGRYEIDWSKYARTVSNWHEKHPNASFAYKKLHQSIKKGEMPKASRLTCARCGKKAQEYHHHNGYGEGHELDVIPLCKSCHRLEHSPYN